MPRIFAIITAVAACSAVATELAPVQVEVLSYTPVGEIGTDTFVGNYQRLERAEIERDGQSLAETLAQESGLQYRQAGGMGSSSTLTIRGGSAAHTGVYLDGIKLNDAVSGSVDLNEIGGVSVDSVELFRGSAPLALSGSNMGGAVNLRSPRVLDSQGRVKLTLGSFGQEQLQGSYQHSSQQADWLLSLNGAQADNDFDFLYDNRTRFNPNDDEWVKRNNAEVSQLGLLAKAGFYPSDEQEYQVALQASGRTMNIPERTNWFDNNSELRHKRLQLQALSRFEPYAGWHRVVRGYINLRQEHYRDLHSKVGLGAQNLVTDSHVLGISGQWDNNQANKPFNTLIEFRREALDAEDSLSQKAYQAERLLFNAAVQRHWQLPHSLSAESTLRAQLLSDNYHHVEDLSDRNDQQWGLDLAMRKRWEQWQAFTSLAWVYRQPVFFELMGDSGLYKGNSDLLPERGLNTEFGLEWHAAGQASLGASLAVFANHREDLIASTYNSQGIGRSENIAAANIQGLEISAKAPLGKRFDWKGNLTWQHSDNQADYSAYKNKQLPNEPELALNSQIQWRYGSWSALYQISVKHNFFYDAANLLKGADATLHNVSARYTAQDWQLKLSLLNLSDENYEDFNGYPKPGRTLHMSAGYQF